MDISFKQLSHYFNTPLSLESVVAYLTQMGVEVESIDNSNPTDPRLALEITPNRPDLNHYLGLAREIAGARREKSFVRVPSELLNTKTFHSTPACIQNALDDSALCPRYYLREITGITLMESPEFIRTALQSSGIAVKNNIVDIINFVMLETGQPMHACDKQTLTLPIHIQQSPNNKTVTTLDKMSRQITTADILIQDDAGQLLAIGGVMGSAHAEISEKTTAIYVECAYFDRFSIRKTAKRLGLTTDSSRRFELGADPEMILPALERATALLLQYGGGTVGNTYYYDTLHQYEAARIVLNLSDISLHLGITPEPPFIETALEALGFEIEKTQKTSWTVTVPSHRQYDVKTPFCLIEEIAKVYDYNKIPNQFPNALFSVRAQPRWLVLKKQSETFFSGQRFHQAINFSFTHPNAFLDFKPEPENPYCQFVTIEKPLNQDLSILRTSLLPGLLTNYQYNKGYGIAEQSFFEIGKRFYLENTTLCDEEMLAGLRVGTARQNTWKDHAPSLDFHDIKALLWGFFHYIGIDCTQLTVKQDKLIFFLPEEQASIYYQHHLLGTFGRLKTSHLAKKPKEAIYGFELSLTQLEQFDSARRSHYDPPSKYPSIVRDLSVICPLAYPSEKITQIVKNASKGLLKNMMLTDVYRGKPIQPGFESLSYSFEFNSDERTLTNEELNPIMENVIQTLTEKEELAIRQ